MTTLIQSDSDPNGQGLLKAYRISRNNLVESNNNNSDGDDFWLKIIKNKNERTKIELMSRVLYRSGSYSTVFGFPLFDIGNSSSWTKYSSTGTVLRPELTKPVFNIIIIDFRDPSMEHRNFLNNGEFPELNYLIVRLTNSQELPSSVVSIQQEYMNYKFVGEVIGPIDFTEFNTNYCLMRTIINNSDGTGIQNTQINLDDFFIYHKVNWCTLLTSDVNTLNDLNFNVKIKPEYLEVSAYYTAGTYNNVPLITEDGTGSGAKVNVITNDFGVSSILVVPDTSSTSGSQGSGYNANDLVKISASEIGGPEGLFFRVKVTTNALELDSSGGITGRLLARASAKFTLTSGNSGYSFPVNYELKINSTTVTKTYPRASQTLTISGTPDNNVTYKFKIGNSDGSTGEFSCVGQLADSSGTAQENTATLLTNQLNASFTPFLLGDLSATVNSNVITITGQSNGTFFTMESKNSDTTNLISELNGSLQTIQGNVVTKEKLAEDIARVINDDLTLNTAGIEAVYVSGDGFFTVFGPDDGSNFSYSAVNTNMVNLISELTDTLVKGSVNIRLLDSILNEDATMHSKEVLLKDMHTVVDSFYDDGIYTTDEFFWSSLKRQRFLPLIVISTLNADEIARDTPPNQRYNGVFNGLDSGGNPILRYIKNYVYDDIIVGYGTTGTTITHLGNKGGGYRLTSNTIELVRETTVPYYYNNGSNTNTTNTYQNSNVMEEYHSLDSTTSDIWEMRTNGDVANYFEIRYKPLFPLIDGVNLTITGSMSIKFNFYYIESSITEDINQAKVTFERFDGMDGTLTPPGNKFKNALRNDIGEQIQLDWSGNNINEKRIVLIDIASGYSTHDPLMSVTNTNLYSSIVATDYNITAKVYQYRLLDRVNNDRDKLFNQSIVLFNETNTSDMVLENKQYQIEIYPQLDVATFQSIIFDYDDDIERFSNGTDALLRSPLNSGINNPVFSIGLTFEKVNMKDFVTTGTFNGFSNATSILNTIAENGDLLNTKNIFISKNSSGESDFFSGSTSTAQSSEDVIVGVELNNFSIDAIAIGKGLVNSLEKTEPHYSGAVNSFLLKGKYFLSDYWKFDKVLSKLAFNSIIDTRFLQYSYQYKTIATLLLIDIKFSGQVFLINTANGKTNISYTPTITSLDVGDQVKSNPVVNFNKFDNILPTIDATNPLFLRFISSTTNNNSIFTSTKPAYPGSLNNTTIITDELNQPLHPTTPTSNILDMVSVFRNNGATNKIDSTPAIPTQYNGIYYFNILAGSSGNENLTRLNLFPGQILVNLVELPDIQQRDTTIELATNNSNIKITWPRYYYNSEQGEITWTIVRQDMANFTKVTRTYDINSTEITIIGNNVVYIDREIRQFDKYVYTISGEFKFNSDTSDNSMLSINGVRRYANLSLEIPGFTTEIVFVCFGYTSRFPFGRFNTTSTNLKLFAPKLLRSDLNQTTKNLFASQLLLTNPPPAGYTEQQWLDQIQTWPKGRGACVDENGNTETFGRNLTQSNENIFANTTNQLSKKQTYVALARSRFRPNR